MGRVVPMLAVLVAAVPASAQVVAEMTPDAIRQAVSDQDVKPCYEMRFVSDVIGKDRRDFNVLACFSTPYSRVAFLARQAREKLETFDAAALPSEVTAPELQIHAYPRKHRSVTGVEKIVLMPKGSTDPASAIAPLRTDEKIAQYSNAMGATYTARSVTAVYPLAVLSQSNVVRIVYEGPVCAEGSRVTSQCVAEFTLKGVR